MKEKIRNVVKKLISAVIAASEASLHCSAHLTAYVYFRYGAMHLMPKQEEILRKTHELVLLQK